MKVTGTQSHAEFRAMVERGVADGAQASRELAAQVSTHRSGIEGLDLSKKIAEVRSAVEVVYDNDWWTHASAAEIASICTIVATWYRFDTSVDAAAKKIRTEMRARYWVRFDLSDDSSLGVESAPPRLKP